MGAFKFDRVKMGKGLLHFSICFCVFYSALNVTRVYVLLSS